MISPYQSITRRDFVRQTASLAAVGCGAAALPGLAAPVVGATGKVTGVRSLKEPVAIAMWDFSWLLRHEPGHATGSEFADWDRVLDGLVERGYNAVRIDAFPNHVAAGPDGKVTERVLFPRYDKDRVIWGNPFPTTVEPRRALKEFIPRCLDRGLLIGLSTWFVGPGTERIAGLDGLVRVWDETLRFLKDNDLLHNIYYVDLLNEYPLFNGFQWLRDHMDGDIKARGEKAKNERVYEWKEKAGNYNSDASRRIYTGFANDAIDRLKKNWPELDFLFSLSYNAPGGESVEWRVMAPTKIAALDYHVWFQHNPQALLLGAATGAYIQATRGLSTSDAALSRLQAAIEKNWATNKPRLVEWMDQQMAEVAALGRKYGKPVGNTEGWGLIGWFDHPPLNWEIIKEAGEICAKLGRKHGYRFNCSSNFAEPQFPRLWADVAWHKRVTGIIRTQ